MSDRVRIRPTREVYGQICNDTRQTLLRGFLSGVKYVAKLM